MVFKTLNRLKWKGGLQAARVVILHRGAPGDRKVIPGSRITQVKKSHFYYKDGGRESFMPLHRILEIRLDGETIWKRSTKKG
jgi:uncharacterized protein (UPF0248 family)